MVYINQISNKRGFISVDNENIKIVETDLSIITVISRAFFTLLEQPGLYLGLGTLAVLPLTIVWLIAPSLTTDLVERFINMICGALISAAIAYAVYQSFMGNYVDLRTALSQGFSSFKDLIGVAFFTNIAIFIGLLLLIIPGIILSCMLSVVIPACIVEKLGPMESATRSFNITEGYRLKIFGIMLIWGIITVALLVVGGIAAATTGDGSNFISIIIISLFLIIPQTLYGIITALIYSDLRLIKEGISADSLADIFD